MKSITYCTVEGCETRCQGNGLCSKHYQRVLRLGTTQIKRCMGVGNTVIEKFWSRVILTADDSRCWLWVGGKSNFGYGIMTDGQKNWLTHHYAWFLTTGVAPTRLLLHSCDVPACVNPKHLREGTQKENVFDMMSRQRSAGYSITKDDVQAVVSYLNGGKNAFQIHKMTGIHYHSIRAIRDGRHWSLGLLQEV